MSVRVRFAPSPTGYLHIGGARTALYSYLFAKSQGGKYILRIEDTDLERSEKEYEERMIDDLHWLGISHDEGPDVGGDFGPYRQSERLDEYKRVAWEWVEKGLAYPCFLTQEEIDSLTEKAKAKDLAPHAYHGHYRDLPLEEAKKRINNGESYSIRFKNPGKKQSFQDIVRGEVTFPEDMVGDFVILRSSGHPVYNYCCALDDNSMKISHVIRAEEHLNNTCRQLMLYEALGANPPQFAHVSLLVGEDRQKLSKRHGATSVKQYRDQHYLPEALMNYLCLLGWSHPEEKDIFTLKEIEGIFDLSRFSKSSALYDIQKLNYFNEQHLRLLEPEDRYRRVKAALPKDSRFHEQDEKWQRQFVELFKEKLQLLPEYEGKLDFIFDEHLEEGTKLEEVLAWESTRPMAEFLKEQLSSASEVTEEVVGEWMNVLKKEKKIKGKSLFMGLRALLTGKTHGPDLKPLIVLTPKNVLQKRLEQALQKMG